jgi:hypothetical protein
VTSEDLRDGARRHAAAVRDLVATHPLGGADAKHGLLALGRRL